MNSTNKKAPGARGIPQPFNRQTGHTPEIKPVVAQLKTAVSEQGVKPPAAPRVYRQQPPAAMQPKMANGAVIRKPPAAPPPYRPQQVPKVLQTKSSTGQNLAQAPRHPVASPAYRPEAKKIVQPNYISPGRKSPTAPPVYRPEQKSIARPKMASAAPTRTPPKASPVYRPQAKLVGVQAKMAGSSQSKKPPVAPPVYRPQPLPKVLQTKTASAQRRVIKSGTESLSGMSVGGVKAVVQGKAPENLSNTCRRNASGARLIQRKLEIAEPKYEFDEWNFEDNKFKELAELIKSKHSNRYYAPDLIKVIERMKYWAEHDEVTVSYQTLDSAVEAAAAQVGVIPLKNPGGFEELPDPETKSPLRRTTSTDNLTVGTKEYWVRKKLDASKHINIKEHPENYQYQENESVLGGHGYRKPWENDTVTVPKGTTLVFYVFDNEGLPEHDSNQIAFFGPSHSIVKQMLSKKQESGPSSITSNEKKLVFNEGEPVLNYTVVPPQPQDSMIGPQMTVENRRKLSEILRENLGVVHVAICREVDWWGGFATSPGQGELHKMPTGWKYVKGPNYQGYESPEGGRGQT